MLASACTGHSQSSTHTATKNPNREEEQRLEFGDQETKVGAETEATEASQARTGEVETAAVEDCSGNPRQEKLEKKTTKDFSE